MSLLPPGFRWGWATAATEVEGGGLRNSWTRWLDENAERLAREAATQAEHIPVWQQVRETACDPQTYRYGAAIDHWNRYQEDYGLAQQLGFDAGQITVDWSRVETGPGRYDRGALSHYRDMVSCLHANGQEPFVQLWHFADPLWLRDGWADPQAPRRFAAYAERVAEALGDLVRYWITIEEPKLYTFNGFVRGNWPPGRRNPALAASVALHLVQGHRRAAAALRRVAPGAQVGVPVNNVWYEAAPGRFWPLDRLLAKVAHGYENHLFEGWLVEHSDWVGLNYYVRVVMRRLRAHQRFHDGPRSDVGLDLVPGGLYPLLRRAGSYGKPVYVTEFGLADFEDRYRAWYVEQSLLAIARASADGVDVRGAFYWSLLDDLEWDMGYWPRFGMIEVDRATLRRSPRPSAYPIRDLVAAMRATGGRD